MGRLALGSRRTYPGPVEFRGLEVPRGWPNRDALERLPSAFFSVSLAAHDNMEEAEGYIEEFVRETGWRPAKVGLFGGALLYTHYGFIKRHIMKKIARDKGNPDTDTSRDYTYTEWDGVKHFVEEFLKTLVPEATRDPQS